MKYLTITVPCFNSEKYLKRCLDSLIICGTDVEIIVVDDGSTDQTGEIAELYAKWFPEIVTVVHKENGGHGSGVNTGLKLAKGRYFKVVDSDDWLEETAYRELLKKIKIWEETKNFRPSQYLIMHALIYRTDVLRKSGVVLPEHTLSVNYPVLYGKNRKL